MPIGRCHDAHTGLDDGHHNSGITGDRPGRARYLLDRVPVLAVGRNDRRDRVAVGVALAAAVVFGAALLDPDLGDEAQAVEIAELCGAGLARLLARVVGLNSACGFEDRTQLPAGDFGSFGVAVGRAADDHALPELALRVRTVDDHELAVEHFAAAVLDCA